MQKRGTLALDVGTSSIRASLYVKDEGMKCTFSEKHYLEERFYIEELWKNIFQLIKKMTRSLDDVSIEVIGVSAFLGWVIVNKNGEPIDKAWSWMSYGDKRELKKAQEIFDEDIHVIIGRELTEQLGVFYWGKNIRTLNEDAIILSVKDFINYKLTNSFMMDRSHASYTGLYSIKESDWDFNLFKAFDLPFSAVPRLGYGNEIVGNVSRRIQSQLGLSEDTKVILGGPDGTLAILGSGGFKSGCSIEVMGTTDVFFHVIDSADTKAVVQNGLVQNSHILPGLFCVGGPTGMTGGTLDWLMRKKNWNYDHKDFRNMVNNWKELKAAESGLFIISALTGARVPDWNPHTRGTIVGLNPSHNFEEIFKATLEGISFNTKRIINKIQSVVGAIHSIIAIGGGAKNHEFIQTRASIAGRSILIPKEIEASTFGILALASVAIDWYETIEEAVSRLNPIKYVIEPNDEDIKKYYKLCEQYDKLVKMMNEWYH